MRISTSQFFESTSATYQNNFSSVIKTQQQIDSGVRIRPRQMIRWARPACCNCSSKKTCWANTRPT